MDVYAPGVEIPSGCSGSDTCYEANSGTSMGSPWMAGLSALLLIQDNTLSAEQVKLRLTQGSRVRDLNGNCKRGKTGDAVCRRPTFTCEGINTLCLQYVVILI